MKTKLGTRNRKKTLIRGEENIDPQFFQVNFKINGKVFEVAVDWLLKLEKENLDEVSDTSLDEALDNCSYYRYTFLAAGVELEKALAKKERLFNSWYASTTETVKLMIMKERLETKKELKVPNNWFGSLTKQEVEHRILTDKDYSVIYDKYQRSMSELRRKIKLTFGIRDILQDRGGHLQSIGRRRLEHRKQKDFSN